MSAAPSTRRPPAVARACVLAALCAATAGAQTAAAADGSTSPPTLAVCADPSNLPYSNQREQGFENRIAQLLADELHATLRTTWNVQRRSFLRRTLQSGACDVVLGLPQGLPGALLTRPYYRSSYVFVTRADRGLQLQGFDDPALRSLRIGLQAVGAEGASTPPAMALSRRGIVQQITGFPMWAEEADETPQGRIIDAVARGEVDVAIVWGPFAGYFAQAHGQQLQITPVAADPQQPALAFQYAMSAGVRRGDTALRDAVQQALDRRAADVQAILKAYGVPLVDSVIASATQPVMSATPTGPQAATSGE